MLKIAVADDDFTICAQIDAFLRQFFLSSRYKLNDYSDGAELIKDINDNVHYDIIFLDIEMRCYDGIKTAELIRRSDPMENIYIIYVSSHEDNLIPLFRFHPFGFIPKPLEYNTFKTIMNNVITNMNNLNLRIKVNVNNDTVFIPIRQITYIESLGRKLIIHLCSGQSPVECYGKINEILSKLCKMSDDFCRLHKSFIANRLYIEKLNSKFAVVQGVQLPLGPKYRDLLFSKRYNELISATESEET